MRPREYWGKVFRSLQLLNFSQWKLRLLSFSFNLLVCPLFWTQVFCYRVSLHWFEESIICITTVSGRKMKCASTVRIKLTGLWRGFLCWKTSRYPLRLAISSWYWYFPLTVSCPSCWLAGVTRRLHTVIKFCWSSAPKIDLYTPIPWHTHIDMYIYQ